MTQRDEFKNLIFLDTETTGRDENDRIFQVAYRIGDEEKSELFKPPLPLCIEAMEATGYTNKDVEGKPAFEGSSMQARLKEIFSNNEIIFVAHNAPFDITMLKKDGIEVGEYIDTLKVARHLDNEAKLGAYRLQYLRYALDLDVKDAPAHDALADVRVLVVLFERLYAKMVESAGDPGTALAEMIEISKKPSLIRRINFGKYSGKLVSEVAVEDKGYLQWLLQQKQNDTGDVYGQNEDWIYTLEQELGITK